MCVCVCVCVTCICVDASAGPEPSCRAYQVAWCAGGRCGVQVQATDAMVTHANSLLHAHLRLLSTSPPQPGTVPPRSPPAKRAAAGAPHAEPSQAGARAQDPLRPAQPSQAGAVTQHPQRLAQPGAGAQHPQRPASSRQPHPPHTSGVWSSSCRIVTHSTLPLWLLCVADTSHEPPLSVPPQHETRRRCRASRGHGTAGDVPDPPTFSGPAPVTSRCAHTPAGMHGHPLPPRPRLSARAPTSRRILDISALPRR